MLNCPVCQNMGGLTNTKLTELDTEVRPGGGTIERTMECDSGHEFIVVYRFAMFEYVHPDERKG